MKNVQRLVVILALALSLTACSAKHDAGNTTAPETEVSQAETSASENESETDDEEGEEDAEPIPVADYDPTQYVTMADYNGMPVDIVKSEVTDDDVSDYINSEMMDNMVTVDKDAAAEGDSVEVTWKVESNGKEIKDLANIEGEEIVIGNQYYGEAIDNALIGAKAGDTKTAEVDLEEIFGVEDPNAKTGTVTMQVQKVMEYQMPELNDEYVKSNTSYKSVAEYQAAIKEKLTEQADESAEYEAGYNALTTLAEQSTFNGYPEDLYANLKAAVEDTYNYYASILGSTKEELISEEELNATILEEVNNAMLIKAIGQKENVPDVTAEELADFLEKNYSQYGFASKEEMAANYNEDDLRQSIKNDKILDALLAKCQLNYMTEEEYAAAHKDEEEAEGEGQDEVIEEDEEAGTAEDGANEANTAESAEITATELQEEAADTTAAAE